MADTYDTDHRRSGRRGTAPKGLCGFAGCDNKAHARGLCTGHWRQWSKGQPLHSLSTRNRVIGGMKRCSDCHEVKLTSEFHKKLYYVAAQCRSCYNIRLRAKTYGLTRDEVLALMSTPCEACGREAAGRELNIDHCHESGRVRGALCLQCNTALGLVNEDPERLRGLIAYIERTH